MVVDFSASLLFVVLRSDAALTPGVGIARHAKMEEIVAAGADARSPMEATRLGRVPVFAATSPLATGARRGRVVRVPALVPSARAAARPLAPVHGPGAEARPEIAAVPKATAFHGLVTVRP